MASVSSHNHLTREVQPRGECEGCDDYWRRVDEVNDPDFDWPPGPRFPPTPPFRQKFG